MFASTTPFFNFQHQKNLAAKKDRHVIVQNKLNSSFRWEIINFPAAFSNLPIIILSDFDERILLQHSRDGNVTRQNYYFRSKKKRNHYIPGMDCLPSVEHFEIDCDIWFVEFTHYMILTSFRVWWNKFKKELSILFLRCPLECEELFSVGWWNSWADILGE